MSGFSGKYTTEQAMNDLLMWIGDGLSQETKEHLRDVLEKLDSASWELGYKDAKNDYEVY